MRAIALVGDCRAIPLPDDSPLWSSPGLLASLSVRQPRLYHGGGIASPPFVGSGWGSVLVRWTTRELNSAARGQQSAAGHQPWPLALSTEPSRRSTPSRRVSYCQSIITPVQQSKNSGCMFTECVVCDADTEPQLVLDPFCGGRYHGRRLHRPRSTFPRHRAEPRIRGDGSKANCGHEPNAVSVGLVTGAWLVVGVG